MDNHEPSNALDSVPRLYALQREVNDDEPATVVAWGMALADGSTVTLRCGSESGAAVAVGTVQNLAERARLTGVDLVWLPDPMPARPESPQ